MCVAIGSGCYEFNLVTTELRVDPSVQEAVLHKALRHAGFRAKLTTAIADNRSLWEKHRQAIVFAVAAILTVGGGVAEHTVPGAMPARIMLAAAILIGGWSIIQKALGALANRALDMNVLMSIAVVGAVAIDRWTEGAAVILLFSLSLILESYSIARTSRAVQSLMALSPQQASVIRNGCEAGIAAEDVAVGEVVVIRPGERVPLDGTVIEGSSTVNQSPITGESAPVPKSPGATVFAGTLNERGALTIRTTKRFEDT